MSIVPAFFIPTFWPHKSCSNLASVGAQKGSSHSKKIGICSGKISHFFRPIFNNQTSLHESKHQKKCDEFRNPFKCQTCGGGTLKICHACQTREIFSPIKFRAIKKEGKMSSADILQKYSEKSVMVSIKRGAKKKDISECHKNELISLWYLFKTSRPRYRSLQAFMQERRRKNMRTEKWIVRTICVHTSVHVCLWRMPACHRRRNATRSCHRIAISKKVVRVDIDFQLWKTLKHNYSSMRNNCNNRRNRKLRFWTARWHHIRNLRQTLAKLLKEVKFFIYDG